VEISRSDKLFLLLLAVQAGTLTVGIIGLGLVLRVRAADWQLTSLIIVVLLGMAFLSEWLTLLVLLRFGYVCHKCRSRSVAADARRAIRGYRCEQTHGA